MANILSLLFIPVFAESLGASYVEVGIIVGVYSATTLLSSFIFGRLADLHHLRTVLLGGFGFAVAAFLLQVFATDPFTLMLARALVGFSVGVHPGALYSLCSLSEAEPGKVYISGFSWLDGGFFHCRPDRSKNGPAFCVFISLLRFLFFAGF